MGNGRFASDLQPKALTRTMSGQSISDYLGTGDWRERLHLVMETMREVSEQTDPQEMVRVYTTRMRATMKNDAYISVSRRDLPPPLYRITRWSGWTEAINPWKQKDRLPLLRGGLLGELLYGNEARIIDDLRLSDDDPAAPYLKGCRSLLTIPQFDGGSALNMTCLLCREPQAFDPEAYPDLVLRSNLFGQATRNLVLSDELRRAYSIVDRELKVVADIQRSLLPRHLPRIPTLDLAAHYQTSRWAGGDYYDIFPLPDGSWGILIADVSGHGTPAAVMMAITHSIAHTHYGPPTPPSRLLNYLNHQLATRYTADNETFVTAFYGIYDPVSHTLHYSAAGHNPPRLKSCLDGRVASLDGASGLPLGIAEDLSYQEHTHVLRPGDQVVFYTDGVTDAESLSGQMFGIDRLDEAMKLCSDSATDLIGNVLSALDQFTDGQPAADDRTLLVAKVR